MTGEQLSQAESPETSCLDSLHGNPDSQPSYHITDKLPDLDGLKEVEDQSDYIKPPLLVINQQQLPILEKMLDIFRATTNWEEDVENNPLYDLSTNAMVHISVIDYIACYLQHIIYHGPHMAEGVLIIPPSIYHTVTCNLDTSQAVDFPTVWAPEVLPTRLLLPIVEQHDRTKHWFLIYGIITEDHGSISMVLNYIDSLPRPNDTVIRRRFQLACKVIRVLFPQFQDKRIKRTYQPLPTFRQASGSLDCGIFCCQVLLAIGFEQTCALLDPLPVQDVKDHMLDILKEVQASILDDIAQGGISGVGIPLHRLLQSGVQGSMVFLKDIIPVPTTFGQPSSAYSSKAPTPAPSTPQVQISSPLCHALLASHALANHLLPDQVEPSRLVLDNSLSSPNPLQPPVCPIHSASSVTNEQASTSGKISTLMSGHTFTYGRPAPHEFREGQQWSTFFGDLREPQCNWPVGMLQGIRSRKVNDVLAGVFLAQSSPQSTLPPGITIVPGPTTRRDTSGMAIAEFTQHLLEIEDLFERQKALLSGGNPDRPLKLNWLKDTIDLEEDWLLPSVDIDSLSLTISNPKFMEPVVIHAYPPRAATISTDNGLKVLHNGQERPLSHSVQNFCCFSVGTNNQFKVNIFFPNYVVPRANNRRYKTFMKNMDYCWWYDEVFLVTLEKVSNRLPPNLMPAYVQATQELPAMYFVAEKRAVSASKGGQNFTGHKMIPELLNHILPIMREIVERKDDLAHFRGFFFHIYGINLKTVGQGLDGQEQGNLLWHIFNMYPIVDWDKQNPQDVVVDFSLEINIDPRHLPADINHVTLLWDFDNVLAILRDTWALH
ncbi:Cell wall alpha-1,3-glucan synthase ags1 [Ceratobasidium theobromae]|uniref:Cell wall alpha-1,3-glucan synthase ags1 n=1 Tax=Ceratobasidium theobromae TaxID=1582974 RepID=A0A5N5Q8M9_9AGAM|nr:Cell wall alpha-1,3-glucan synthase ags1 [Ceratobasidium theobromae]